MCLHTRQFIFFPKLLARVQILGKTLFPFFILIFEWKSVARIRFSEYDALLPFYFIKNLLSQLQLRDSVLIESNQYPVVNRK